MDIVIPCATQNELDVEDAVDRTLWIEMPCGSWAKCRLQGLRLRRRAPPWRFCCAKTLVRICDASRGENMPIAGSPLSEQSGNPPPSHPRPHQSSRGRDLRAGSPGMVMMSPVRASRSPPPADTFTFRPVTNHDVPEAHQEARPAGWGRQRRSTGSWPCRWAGPKAQVGELGLLFGGGGEDHAVPVVDLLHDCLSFSSMGSWVS